MLPKGSTREALGELRNSSYIGVSTGFWYEWSLPMPLAFGFDITHRSVTFFDEGEAKASVSTWAQVWLLSPWFYDRLLTRVTLPRLGEL